MKAPMIKYPCDGCETQTYAGFGFYECARPDQTCDELRVCEWAEEVAFDISTMIARATYVEVGLRRQFATEICDAFTNLLYEVRAKIDCAEFMRSAGLPDKEVAR